VKRSTETESTTVECYSGYTYAQEPRALVWKGARLLISAVERSWRTPSGRAFRVLTADGRRLWLSYDEATDSWTCEALNA
jgi:hypothetical protein